jgi:myxalamid-type nonribosomal peptide synthetase MxaA
MITDPRARAAATRLVGQLVADGVEISLDGNDVTYSGPARVLTQARLDAMRGHKQDVVSLLRDNRARGVVALGPTSYEQRRMEWRNRADRNSATYNVCMRLDLHGRIDQQRLARVVTTLVEHHEILRTRFVWYGDHLLQEILAPPRTVLRILEPTTLCNLDTQKLEAWSARTGAASFDLAGEAPARWCYAQLGPESAILLITLHHIACDGWSIDRLLADFQERCRAEAASDQAPTLARPALTPREFATWEARWLTEERIASARLYWSDVLHGAALVPALEGGAPNALPGGNAGCVVQCLPSTIAADIKTASHCLGLSEFSLFFAAYVMLLHELIVLPHFVVVIAMANRTRPEHEEVVGLTRNALPIRCSVGQDDTLANIAQNISAQVESALELQWVPIGLITPPAGSRALADLNRLPITFGVARSSDPTLDCGDFSVTVNDVYLGAARAEFSLLVRYGENVVEAVFEYSKSLFDREQVASLAARYAEIAASEFARLGTTQGGF